MLSECMDEVVSIMGLGKSGRHPNFFSVVISYNSNFLLSHMWLHFSTNISISSLVMRRALGLRGATCGLDDFNTWIL